MVRGVLAVVTTVVMGCSAIGCSAGGEPAAQPGPASSTTTAGTAAASAPTAAAPAGADSSQVIRVTVAGGRISPPPATVEVRLGATVVIEVTTDSTDELHVHGYDRTLALPAGQPARLELPAVLPGQFEVELHEGHLVLFTLRVR